MRRSERLVAQLSVTIEQVLPNGDYLIVGEQRLHVNGEKTLIAVRGRIRPEDIRSDNSVLSSRIADAQFNYEQGLRLAQREAGGCSTASSRCWGWADARRRNRFRGGPLLAVAMPTAPAMAQSVPLKSLGRFDGWRENALVGYGTVTGLAGSGDTRRSVVTRRVALRNVLSRLGTSVSEDQLSSPQRRGGDGHPPRAAAFGQCR